MVIKNNQAVTSSLQIAGDFGKRHDNVLRDIENLRKDLLNFEDMFMLDDSADRYGRKRKIYLMNRDGFALLAMGFTGRDALNFKLSYINQFNKMEEQLRSQEVNQFALPTTYKEALLQLVEQVEINEELQLKLETSETNLKIAEPQANKYKAFLNTDGYMNGSQLAKFIGNTKFGRNKIYEFLKEQKVFMKNDNTPYQTYMSKGYFKVVFSEYGNGQGVPTTLFTPKGADFVVDLAKEHSKIQ